MNDKRHGEGILHSKDSSPIKSIWCNDTITDKYIKYEYD